MTDLTHAAPASTVPVRTAGTTLDRWSRWLVVWLAIVAAISLATVLIAQVSGELFDLALFGSTDRPAGFTNDAVEYQRFIWGITGALTIGWMLLAVPVVRGPFRRGERWAWVAIAESFAGWFLIDSTMSVALGFAENVAVNVLFVVGVVPALVATRPGRR